MKRAEYYSENVCPSRKHVRYAPRAALNKYGKWVFIANSFKTDEDLEICQEDETQERSVDGVSVRHTFKIYSLLCTIIT